MVVRLVTFGDPRLTDGEGNTIPFPEKAILALAYMLVRGLDRMSRADLAHFLWGEADSTNAYVNLRQLILRIKGRQKEAGIPLFEVYDSEVRLNTGDLFCDYLDLKDAFSGGSAAALAGIGRYVTGEFLGLDDTASERAQLWLRSVRDELVAAISARLEQAVTELDLRRNAAVVKDAAYRLLEADPFSDSAYRALMLTFASDGLLSQAKSIFARYKSHLWNDLGVQPQGDMLTLYRQLFESRELAGLPAEALSALPERALPAAGVVPGCAPGQANGVSPGLSAVPAPVLARLAVLPVSSAGGRMQLVNGMLEDVSIGLSRSRTFVLVAPYTAQRLAQEPNRDANLFRRHDISYVLECRLVPPGTLYCTLVDVLHDEVIWAEKFDASAAALPQSYQAIIRRLVASVAGQVERAVLSRLATVSEPDAYQQFLMGQIYLKTADLPAVRRAKKSFRSALRHAPDFAAALSGLSRTEHLEWLLMARGDASLLQSAESLAIKAILADGDNPDGYRELGVTKLYLGDFDECLDAFQGAENSAPGFADLLASYADALVHSGELDLALEKISKAVELNPLCPDVYWWTYAGVRYFKGSFEEAIECIARMENPIAASRLSAASWAMLGDIAKARGYVSNTMEIYPDFAIDNWLSIIPLRQEWQRELYKEGLSKAGFLS